MRKSLAVLLLAAVAFMVSTSVMADTWQVTAINDTGVPVYGIELTLTGTGSGITGPIAVNPNPVVFSSPPPGNELNANWVIPLNSGQAFVADFDLPPDEEPALFPGISVPPAPSPPVWVVPGNSVPPPTMPANPSLITFTDISVPEPSSIALLGIGAIGLAAVAHRRMKKRIG
jgi:hypothetical protein